ncbi:MAG: alfin [Cuspidothrix sp.]
MISQQLQNIIFHKYLDSHKCILEQICSHNFWNTCNTDEIGEILFFSNPTELGSEFYWGNIELNQFRESWSLLSHEILYLIPLPPVFRANQLKEYGYPERLYGYQPIPIERYEWTLNFARIIDSWLMAAIIYDGNLLSKQDRLNLIANINAHPTLFDICQSLQFSEDDSKIPWNKLPEAISNRAISF